MRDLIAMTSMFLNGNGPSIGSSCPYVMLWRKLIAPISTNRESLALTAAAGGDIGGTPGYCSPEQWFGLGNINARTDIFSLGIIFYEMMTRKRPPTYDNKMNRAPVPPPSKFHKTISQKLDQCILKMIDIRPENRQQSIWDLSSEIETLPDNYA
jgi:serine/threonine-protein kinase